jgi:hypothetical protein
LLAAVVAVGFVLWEHLEARRAERPARPRLVVSRRDLTRRRGARPEHTYRRAA